MVTPKEPKEGPEQVENLLASPELAQAIANDNYKRILDNLPVAIAVLKRAGNEHRIAYRNPLFAGFVSTALQCEIWTVLKGFVREDGVDLGTAVVEADDFLGIFRSAEEPSHTVEAYIGRIED